MAKAVSKPNSTPDESKPEDSASAKETITAKDVVKEFEASWGYAKNSYHKKWREAWKLANNERVQYGYEGISDTFVPLTFSIIQSTKANLIGGRPKQTYLPTSKDQEADTKTLDAYMDYDWEKGNWQQLIDPWTEDSVTYGTSAIYAHWDTKLDVTTGDVIPIKDFWIDPSCKTIEQAEDENKPAGHRYLTTKDVLKSRMVVNEDFDDSKPESKKNPRLKPLYDHAAIDRVKDWSENDTDRKDKEKAMFDGSTYGDEAQKHQVEVIVRYTNDRKMEILNRKEIILDEKNDLGMLPYAMQTIFKPTSLFYGRGFPEILKQRQEELNDLENQDTDNMSYQLDSMKTVDPKYQSLIPQMKSGPGVIIPLPAGALVELDKPAYNPKAHEKRMEIKNDMQEAVGAGETVQGAVSTSDKTATEINAEQLNAGKRFDVMLQALENGGFKRLGRLRFKLTQLYADKECLVRVVGSKGIRFEKFLKESYKGEYEPRVQLDASVKSEQAKYQRETDQMYAEMAQNPIINLMELTKFALRKRWGLDDDEVDLLLSPPGQVGEAQPGDAPVDPTADPMLAQGAPMAPGAPMQSSGNPLVPDQAPAPDPNAPAPLQPADLIKLYQAAVTAGDTSLSDQITTVLGFTPGPDEPLAITQKNHAMANERISTALSIQDKQHQAEQAQLQAEQAAQQPVAQ